MPSMIYYPLPLYRQNAFKEEVSADFALSVAKRLCDSVVSLPIHMEMNEKVLSMVTDKVKSF